MMIYSTSVLGQIRLGCLSILQNLKLSLLVAGTCIVGLTTLRFFQLLYNKTVIPYDAIEELWDKLKPMQNLCIRCIFRLRKSLRQILQYCSYAAVECLAARSTYQSFSEYLQEENQRLLSLP